MSSKGEDHFPIDFLMTYKAFQGELSEADLATGKLWFSIWENAQQSMREAIEVRARVERNMGRVTVADALEAAISPMGVAATTMDAY